MPATVTLPSVSSTNGGWIAQAVRRRRYDQRAALWQLSHLPRVRKCGYAPAGGGGVEVRQVEANGPAHYGNLQTCGSVHACPVCGPKIRAHKAQDLERLLAAHFATGGGVEFWTETMPHDRLDQLTTMLDAVNAAHRAVLSGKTWAGETTYAHGSCVARAGHTPAGCPRRLVVDKRLGLKATLGIDGTVTALDVTYGANGWHAHLHTVILTARPWDDAQRARFLDYAGGRWANAIVRAGFRRPGFDKRGRAVAGVAVTVLPVAKADAADVARYLADHVNEWDAMAPADRDRLVERASKARTSQGWGVAAEVVRADLKVGRDGGMTPWELLASAVEDGDVDALSRWWEWEEATKGRQSVRWSAGLRDRYNLGEEATDEDIAAAAVGGEIVLVVSPVTWAAMRLVKGAPARLLVEVERGGSSRALAWLATFGHDPG